MKLIDLKLKSPVGGLNERGVTSFIHSVTKQMAVVINGLLITDSPNRSELQIPSLTKHRCCSETHTSSVAYFVGNIISL